MELAGLRMALVHFEATSYGGNGGGSVTERNCGNCRHFMRIESAATGHCTNPLVVSHQGQLVMYRAGEIGCRRGWKQDLWEAADDIGEPAAAASNPEFPIDYGRAAAWADSAPVRPDPLNEFLGADAMDDDDLLDPRRTRDIREAMRRAREMKKREQMTVSRREPFDQPILGSEQMPGEDSVLYVQPAPSARDTAPIVPPVSVDEVRSRVDEMRQPRNYNDPPPSIHFERYDEHFNDRIDSPIMPPFPEDSRRRTTLEVTPAASESVTVEPAFAQPVADDAGVDEYTPYDQPMISAANTNEGAFDYDDGEETAWPEQAPWAEDEGYDQWQQERPKKRTWFSNLLHRQPRQQPLDPRESAFTWEPELQELDYNDEERPIAAEAGYDAPVEQPAYEERPPMARPGDVGLPPLPYGNDDEVRDDYLLADGRFADVDDEDPAARQIDHICATCRYFRPDGTCGNAFAFTYRRRVSDEYLSCSSSIGAWWLPSDHYWESVVSFTHHGQPTPLLERYEIQARQPEADDDVRTP